MNSKKIFWGTILVLVGSYLLLKYYGIFNFSIDWSIWHKTWPIFLILIGIRYLLPKASNFITILTILFLVGIFGYSLYKGRQMDRFESNIFGDSDSSSMPNNLPGSYPHTLDSEKDTTDLEDGEVGTAMEQRFSIPTKSDIQFVSLRIEGGGAVFTSDVSNTNLFEAFTHIYHSDPYIMESSSEGHVESIKLASKNQNKTISGESNTVKIHLNPKVIWDMEVSVGAGKVDYDLSGYKVRKLEVNTGLSAVSVKLGRLLPICHLFLKSGLASFDIKVPKSAGCLIHLDQGLNSTSLQGFQKIDANTFQSSNYTSADHKIEIHYEGGLSKFSVDQY